MTTAPRTCRVCGCTEDNACVTEDGPCHWWPGDGDLCSACGPACFVCDAGAAGTADRRNPLCPAHEPHRAILHEHVVSMQGGGGKPHIALCPCGWSIDRERPGPSPEAEAAIRKHWREVIADV